MDGIDLYAYGTTPNFDSMVVQNFISGANGGPLHLLADPVGPLDAVTKEYVDTSVADVGASTALNPPANPLPNQLWFSSVEGQLYIYYQDPNSAQWVIANNTGIQDAPIGTNAYGRLNHQWVPVLPLSGGIMTGPLVLAQDPTTYFMAATRGYVDISLTNYLPLVGGTITGWITLTNDPTLAHHAANKEYVDGRAGTVTVSDVAPASPLPGQLWFDSIGVQLYVWYIDGGIGSWVQTNAPAFTEGSGGGGGGGGGNFPEAPVTGLIYGRDGSTASWQPVIATLGGAMAGPLYLYNSSPIQDDEAASKRYVDDAVSSGTLWQGNYIVALNDPDLTAVTPLMNGFAWTAITQDPNVPESLLVALPGILAGTLIFNGDSLRYNGVDNLWFQLRGSSLTRTEADSIYVFRDGDQMIGDLYLAGPPWAPTMAADKEYVDSNRVVVSSLAPLTPFEGQLWYDLTEPNLYVWVVDPTSSQWVIAVNPGASATAPPLRRTMVDFEFPVNPADGEIVTTPGGSQYRWDAANNRWDYVPLAGSYVNLTGDTMTGDLFVTNPADGTGLIRISGSDQDSMRIRFRKDDAAQWMLDSDENHFRLLNYAPNGVAGRTAWDVAADNSMFIAHPQSNFTPAFPIDLINRAYLDTELNTKVSRAGDTMTGQLRLINGDIEIDHPQNALIRLVGPEFSAISFKRNPVINEPQWTIGVHRSQGSAAQDSFSFVRFPTGDPANFDIPLEINYNNGDVFVDRARARRTDPIWPDELVTRSYVDQRFAGEAMFIGLLDASTGLVIAIPGHGLPPQGNIPPPDQVPLGSYFICNVAGTIPANSPQVPNTTFYIGDWLISAEIAWSRIGLGIQSAAAANIQLIPPVFGSGNVQLGMETAEAQILTRLPLAGGALTGPLQGPSFQCTVDGAGFITFGTGVFYKGVGTGLVLRTPTGVANAQPQIEDSDGSNRRQILDTINGLSRAGGALSGGISFGSQAVVDVRDISRHIALWGGTTTGFGLNITSGHLNLVASANATSRIGFVVGTTSGFVGEFSNSGLELPGTPIIDVHATNKLYVDNAINAAPRQWTTGANYAINSSVMWDGLPFVTTAVINNAPATPNFATIRLAGGSQGDYWRGVPTGWVTGNWIHLLTMASYGSYRVQMDLFATNTDESLILDITTTYNASRLVISSLSHNPSNFMFDQFRLSATGAANPVRLEAHIRNAGTTPDFKIFVTGFARQNNSNTTTIQKPPTGTAANLGGTQFELIDIESGSTGNAAVPSFVAGAIQTNTGGWIRFPHANTANRDDGRISARLHSRGLNIVGSATEAGDTQRYITLYGQPEIQGNEPFIARSFRSRDDNFGFETFGGGWFYKRSGGGLTLRQSSGNQQPQIESNTGTNRRDIIDTVNGDLRYARATVGAALLSSRSARVITRGNFAGVGNNPPSLQPNSNAIETINGEHTANLFLPLVTYMDFGEPFFMMCNSAASFTVGIDRTDLTAPITVPASNTAVFVRTGDIWHYVATVPHSSLAPPLKFNQLANGYTLPRTRGTNGQTIVSDGQGGTVWTASGSSVPGAWETYTTLVGWSNVAYNRSRLILGGAFVEYEFRATFNGELVIGAGRQVAVLPVGRRPRNNIFQESYVSYTAVPNSRAVWTSVDGSGFLQVLNTSGVLIPGGQFVNIHWTYCVIP